MDPHNLLTAIQHINWMKILKNYHERHYLWEIAKILIPALITGTITFLAMRIIDNKNKKRWLNDGHMKRKVDLEIQIRKFLLGIKGSVPEEYYVMAGTSEVKNKSRIEDIDSSDIADFNQDFETLYKYLENEEKERGANIYEDKSVFALMDEYVCYVPKIKPLFEDFKAISTEILRHGKESAENIKDMSNIYLCFQDVIEKILKKLTVKKIIR